MVLTALSWNVKKQFAGSYRRENFFVSLCVCVRERERERYT